MTGASRATSLGLAVLGIAIGCYAIGFGSPYTLRVLSLAGIFAIAAIGYQFIFGHAGALALSQGTFMGVGAYVAGILDIRRGVAFDAALPFSVTASAVLAVLVAIPALRLRTHYFALATLIVGQMLLLVATSWENMTGGANGIGGISGFSVAGALVPAGRSTLLLVWGFVAAAAIGAWGITRGENGRAFALLRANENAAKTVGIDAARLRAVAFALSAAYAGVAGALYVHLVRVVSPDILEFPVMVTILTITVIGGRRDIAGAIAAAVLIVEVPEWFRFLRDDYLLAYGVLLLIVAVAAPDGLLQLRMTRRAEKRLRVPPLARGPTQGSAIEERAKFSGGSERGRNAQALFRPTKEATVLVSIEDLTKDFGGVRALDGVSFSIGAGEIVGLIGPNGSGKTTLINAITGLVPADRGRVFIQHRDMTRARPHRIARAGLARTFQATALVETLSARDNVAVARARGDAMAWLDAVGAATLAETIVGELAFGDRRLVELARALARRPNLLLLDEPASGLTRSAREDLAARLRGFSNEGLAILIVEHDMAFLGRLADRLICLDSGRVIADGATNAVRSDARVIAAYLGG